MDKVKYLEFKLSDIFDHRGGNSKYTRKYCNSHKGQFEVFTGSTINSFAFINTYDYSEDLLTYSTDGEYAGTLRILTGKYNVGGHRSILIPKIKGINLEYFQYVLQGFFYSKVKMGDVPSLAWRELKNIVLSLPVNIHGELDHNKQIIFVKKYDIISRRKHELISKIEYINEVEIDYISELSSSIEMCLLSDLFEVERGKSQYTKSFCRNNPGEYAVYSADNSKALAFRNNFDYEGKFITLSVNGIAGITKIIDGKFSTNADRVTLIPKVENLDVIYISNVLEKELRKIVKGRVGIKGKNEFTKLSKKMVENVKIPIPIDNKGKFDISEQNRLSKKMEYIDFIKESITMKSMELVDLKLLINN